MTDVLSLPDPLPRVPREAGAQADVLAPLAAARRAITTATASRDG